MSNNFLNDVGFAQEIRVALKRLDDLVAAARKSGLYVRIRGDIGHNPDVELLRTVSL